MELQASDVQRVQAFLEANPDYARTIEGQAPGADAARELLSSGPPPEWSRRRLWYLGFIDEGGVLVGVVDLVEDLFVPGVWHIGFFMTATATHGSGLARAYYQGLEDWMVAAGARWLRLGVVESNQRGRRFWTRQGFQVVRRREGVEIGLLRHTVLVCVKPVGAASLDDYLSQIERDRPGAP